MGNISGQYYFLSYSRTDKEVALKLAHDLKTAHVNIWIDQLDIEAGSLWDTAIETALQNCKGLLFVASKASVSSDNALNEIHYGLREKKSIIPVKIDDCKIPLLLIRHNYIDLSMDYNNRFSELLERLRDEEVLQPVSSSVASSAGERNFKNPASENGPSTLTRKKAKVSTALMVVLGIGLLGVGIALYNWLGGNNRNATQSKASGTKDSTTEQTSGTADSLYEAGREAYDKEDYPTSFALFQKAAHDSNVAAMFNLGYLYSNGEGIDPNPKLAVHWYTKASEKGNIEAMYYLAGLYKKGSGVKQDYRKAMDLYTRAAAGGYKDAYVEIGDLYYEGKGVDMNYITAVVWYKKAAATGEARGTHSLADMYKNGYGVDAADETKANELYEKAKELGYEDQ